jgi:general secretion pathway protein A
MYQTPALKAAVTKLRRAVARKQGLCCIFGDVGMGKSSLLRFLFSAYSGDDNCKVAFLPTGDLPSSYAFLKKISTEFDISYQRSRMAQMDAIEEFLIEQHSQGKTVMLMVDEAQLLKLDYLETIRALLNYETNTEKMVQVILSGQMDLRDRLELRRYRAFRSRIVAPVLMQPLTAAETKFMVAYRLDFWQVPNPFTDAAADRLHKVSGGVPRTILLTCQYAADLAETQGVTAIGPEMIDQGFAELSIREHQNTEAAA